MHSELFFKVHRYLKEGLTKNLKDKESLFYLLFHEKNECFYFELNVEKDEYSNSFLLKFRNEPMTNFVDIGSIDLYAENFEQFNNGSELSLDFKSAPISTFVSLFKSIGGLQKNYEESKKVLSVINYFFEVDFNEFNRVSLKNSLYNAYYKHTIHIDKEIKYDRQVALILNESYIKGKYQHITAPNAAQRRKNVFELNKTLLEEKYSSLIGRELIENLIEDEEKNKLIQHELIYFLTNGFIYNIENLSDLCYNINTILQENEG